MPAPQANQEHFRIGVDLGGSKIEFVALERASTTKPRYAPFREPCRKSKKNLAAALPWEWASPEPFPRGLVL
jgi:hypothetical protein